MWRASALAKFDEIVGRDEALSWRPKYFEISCDFVSNLVDAGKLKQMTSQPFYTSYFGYDGRGPSLHRWIYDNDLVRPGTERARLPGDINGAEYYYFENQIVQWVLFKSLQVIQVVPEEVHSYWFMEEDDAVKYSGIWKIEDSKWLKSFDSQHLTQHHHFILVFYDELVEVICRQLEFGNQPFDIQNNPEHSYYGSQE